MHPKIRVGILLDSVSLPAWAVTAIERTVCSSHAELALLVLNQSPLGRYTTPAGLRRESAPWLYQVFDAIDQRLFVHGQNALSQATAADLFSNVPRVHVTPVAEDGEQWFPAASIEQIRSFRPDVLVKMGFGKLGGDILFAARYGLWAYRWGDYRRIEDGLTGFWEVAGGWPETGAALQHLGADAEHHTILCESWFFTYPYSPARSRNYILWAAASFLPRQVERLHRLGGEAYFREVKKGEPGSKALHPNAMPSSPLTLRIAMKLAFRNMAEVIRRRLYREQWALLFRYGQSAGVDISGFKKISPPPDRFWADPHVVYQEPRYYIFIEEYLYRTRRGHISVLEMDPQGNYRQPVPVLQADTHLSFPSVFEWQGRYYMIPESSEKKTIDLYECARFPDQWTLKMTLMKDVRAVDTTVICRAGTWWLFTAIAEQEAAAPQFELFLYYSDTLFTDRWQPHPMNPIVSDVKKARAAGSVFEKDGKWFRPSQHCSSVYGEGFDLNEIVILSEAAYLERPVRSVRPDFMDGIVATHTYANREKLTVIDVLTYRPKWSK